MDSRYYAVKYNTLYIYIYIYNTQHNNFEGKTSATLRTHERHPHLTLTGQLWVFFANYFARKVNARYRERTLSLCILQAKIWLTACIYAGSIIWIYIAWPLHEFQICYWWYQSIPLYMRKGELHLIAFWLNVNHDTTTFFFMKTAVSFWITTMYTVFHIWYAYALRSFIQGLAPQLFDEMWIVIFYQVDKKVLGKPYKNYCVVFRFTRQLKIQVPKRHKGITYIMNEMHFWDFIYA